MTAGLLVVFAGLVALIVWLLLQEGHGPLCRECRRRRR